MRQFGFEPDGTTASEISQKAAHDRFGIRLEYTTEIPQRIRELKFDAITYWHVFEHLEDPASHVAIWREILAPGGTIVIEVPNVESMGAWLSFDAWLGSDVVHHINHMTCHQIDALLARNGLRIIRREGFSLKFTFPFLWSALLGAAFGTKRFNFDFIFGTLKNPTHQLKSAPVATLNALASTVYLSPFVALFALVGLATHRGEVLRLYIQSVPTSGDM